jgi:hypothetical protein
MTNESLDILGCCTLLKLTCSLTMIFNRLDL